jgi:hypothetical protein
MRVRLLQPLLLGLILLGTSIVGSVYSQDAASTCQPQVQQALEQVGKMCDGLSRNSACYGNNNVKAAFLDSAAADPFAKPGDTANITQLQSIETAPLDEDSKIWGVSLLRLQANVPNTLPGQGVVFILFGDVGVENAVAPDDVFTPAEEAVPVTTRSAVNVRSNPSTNASVLLSAPAGTELPADATSPDKEWLRVVSDTTVGWVNKGVVGVESNAADLLPVLTRDSRTPMQSFYLTSTLGDVNCNQAPPLVVVQGPEGVSVDLTVNGVNISMASTLVLRLSDAHTLEVIAAHGNIRVDGAPLPPGFSVSVPLSDDGHSQAGDLANLHPLSQAELDSIINVELIPANVLNYPIKLPTVSEIAQAAAASGGGGVVNAAAASHVTCRSLRLTSPIENWAAKETPFYWDPAPGATGYRLVIDNVNSFDTTDTTKTLNLGGIASTTLTWSVQALYNGEVACQTRKLTLPLVGSGGANTGGGCNLHYDMATNSMVC